ncbi:MAG TPA: hypothetical protein VGA80_16910 [Flavobacteriaceae bacterium]
MPNELPRRRAYEVSESRPLRYKNQETRASSRLLVLVSWFFAQPDYQDATPEAVPIAIGTIGTSGNYLD